SWSHRRDRCVSSMPKCNSTQARQHPVCTPSMHYKRNFAPWLSSFKPASLRSAHPDGFTNESTAITDRGLMDSIGLRRVPMQSRFQIPHQVGFIGGSLELGESKRHSPRTRIALGRIHPHDAGRDVHIFVPSGKFKVNLD